MGVATSFPFELTAERRGRHVAVKLALTDDQYARARELSVSDGSSVASSLDDLRKGSLERMHKQRAYMLHLPASTKVVNVHVMLSPTQLIAGDCTIPRRWMRPFGRELKSRKR